MRRCSIPSLALFVSRTPRRTRALRFATVLLAAAALFAPVAEAQTAGRGVGSVTVDSPGIGYTSAPTVVFASGGGSGAAAIATLTPSVGSVTLGSGGSGYTTAPSVMFTGGGGGSGAAADAVLAPRGVASVTFIAGGVYTSQPSVTFGPPQTAGGRRATGMAVRTGFNITSVTITDPGSGYTAPPSVTFPTGLGGANAQATAVLEAAAVASVDVTAVGSGYTSVPGVMFTGGGGGSGATANAALSNSVLSVSVTSPGSGYTSAPSVSFLGGGGRGTAATATLEATVVTGVALSSPVLGDTFERAEPIEATVTFAHAVDVDTTGGTPQLALNVGSNTRQASYVSGTGTTELKFRYTVVQADVDNNGITVGASALALNSGTIRLAGSSTVDAMLGLGSHAITDSAGHKVNGAALTAAAVSGVAITSTPTDGDTYRLGESIRVTVTFNRAVNVVTTGGTPQLALTVGTQTRQAAYLSGTGTTALVFNYLLVAGDFDEDGIGVAAGALTLNSGAINDARDATVAAALGLGTHAISDDADHKVATPPFISTIGVNSPVAASTFERGERIEVTLNFNRAVDVTGTPQVALDLTSGTRQADYVSGAGTTSPVFRYTVALGDEDADGLSIGLSALTLNGGTIRAVTADRTDASLGLGSNAVTNDSNRLVDGMRFTAAAVSGVSITSTPTDTVTNTYGLGERIAVQVRFTQRVEVTGTPQVELTVGAIARQADYASGSGTNTLTFHYIVQGAGSGGSGSDGVDADTVDGIAIPANGLALNGGAIDDARDATEAATLTHGAVAASASHKVDGGPNFVVVPTVSGVEVVSAPPAGGSYRAGDEIRVRVTFNRAVRVTGTPQLALLIGSSRRQASYVSGAGPLLDLVFRYVVRPGDVDPNGFSVPANALTGTIERAGEIAGEVPGSMRGADLESAALPNQTGHEVDAPRPPPPPRPLLAIDAPRVTEGGAGTTAALRFTVTMNRTATRTVTVSWEDAGSGTATAGAADAAGADYVTLVPGTLTFAPGTTEQTIEVTVIGDTVDEADETVAVRLHSPENATLPADAEVGTGTIIDDDVDLMPSFGDARVPVQRYMQDVEIAPLALPAATGGNGALTYTLAGPGPSGALPEGLAYTPSADAATGGTLAGTPAVAVEEAVWTLTATDADGDTATLAFTVEVAPADLTPTFGDARVSAQRYIQGTAIAPLVLPAATDGDLPLTYTLTRPGPSGALPEGLSYTPPADAATGGTLAGTPAVPAEEAVWTLTVTDVDGDTATLTFTVEVEADLAPTFGDARVSAQRYMQDVEIAPLALPAATGGNGALTYTLTPVLPEGLTYTPPGDAAGGGVLAGTPAVPVAPSAWTLAAADADGDMATLSFTIEVVDRLRERLKGVNEAILADLSRAMTGSTADAVSGRIGQALAPDGAGAVPMEFAEEMASAFAGLLRSNEEAIGEGTWSWRRGLDGRRFALALTGAGGGGAGSVGVWGAGDYRPLSGGGSGVDWDGHLFGAHVGMDARFGTGGLAGLALSVSEGRLDYTDTSALALGEAVEGKYESEMASAHPYLGWAWGRGTHAWASLGYGQGTIDIDDGEAGRQESGSTLRSAVAGGSVRMFSGEGPGGLGAMTVDLKGEAWTTRLEVEDNGDRIAGLRVRTHRVRVSAEGARAFALGGGGALTPSVELGMRLDGGDGETDAGVELGGGVDYAHPAWGLSADVSGRAVVVHEGGSDDWSVGGAVRLEPASGLGLSLRLAPSYGDTGSGLARLWEDGVAGSGAAGAAASTSNDPSPAARLDTEMGYGLAAFAGTLTPYGGFALSEGGAHGYRMGARYLLGPALELGVEGERREGRSERAEHGLMLRGRMRW